MCPVGSISPPGLKKDIRNRSRLVRTRRVEGVVLSGEGEFRRRGTLGQRLVREAVEGIKYSRATYCLRTTNSRITPASQGCCTNPIPQLSAIIHAPDTKSIMTPGITTLS
jgi:hypothetical protein